ncbi:MAG: glucose 1-dehydrogenase [Dehalococcoidia bacterium]|nr:glucose 1-dehydrogenase [Dehalococcoidia bacterium]
MLADRFRLDGKVAIITGSGKGIGQAIGFAFAEAGAKVVFSARTESDILANAERAKSLGAQALAVPCDVRNDDQLQSLVARTVEAWGKIDIVVNNAGGAMPNQIARTSRRRFNEAFDFNVTSALMVVRYSLPYLQKSKGCVINICSAAGRIVQPNFSVYGTVKAALIHMTRLMASDLAPDVRVNGIAPGSILTDALKGLLDEPSLKKMCERTPMKRLGEVDDIALAAVYLASPAAGWVTGKILEIDGGMEATNMPS